MQPETVGHWTIVVSCCFFFFFFFLIKNKTKTNKTIILLSIVANMLARWDVGDWSFFSSDIVFSQVFRWSLSHVTWLVRWPHCVCLSVCLGEDSLCLPGQCISVLVHSRIFVACPGVTDLSSAVQSHRERKNFQKDCYVMASQSRLTSNKTARRRRLRDDCCPRAP